MARNIINDLRQIFKSSVSAVLPENLIKKSLSYNPITQELTITSKNYNLLNKNLYIIGTGKAVQNMAIEMEKILGNKIKRGIISIPDGSFQFKSLNENMLYSEGAKNNLPDDNAVVTARKVKDLVAKLTHNDILLILLSGGGSALLPLPKESINLKEKTELIKKLANSGADITEINTVRKRISDLKGGQLAIEAQPAQVVSLILSDIVGDPLDLIASGPTTVSEDCPSKAIAIVKKYKLYDDLPNSIKQVLEKTCELKSFPDNVQNIIIGSNKLSIDAAYNEATKLNYCPIKLSNIVTGNVTDIAKKYAELTKIFCDFQIGIINHNLLKHKLLGLDIPGLEINFSECKNELDELKTKDLCLILGGETTVKVEGTGIGGRSQQLALEFSKAINLIKDYLISHEIFILCAGTDGIDGPTDAAGAIGYLTLFSDCAAANINVDHYIDTNDSYNFYKIFKHGELHIKTGHTNTNVMDIHLIILKKI